MPYTSVGGGFERASRVGHREAVLRALADNRQFHVPAEQIPDLDELRARVRPRADLSIPPDSEPLTAAIAIDGSRMVERVREGMPSVVYGYAQAAAAYLDLTVLENQRGERFVDPYILNQAVNTALVSLDLPVAGAYERAEIDIKRSWREALDRIFRSKRIEVNNLNQSLLDLLLMLHGKPGLPALGLEVNCPQPDCLAQAPVPATAAAPEGHPCPECGEPLFTTDVLRIHEEVVEEGTNEAALGRLSSVVELLVLTGLVSLLWSQHRHDLLVGTLFILDGPLAMSGPPAKLRSQALQYFQSMSQRTPGNGPFIVGLEKTGITVDYATSLVRNGVLEPGDLLMVDHYVLEHLANTKDIAKYGKETYWGRKFIYRSVDGRVLVPTVVPGTGPPYDDSGGQPDPASYPSLPAILDVFDRTGSSMYQNGIIPVALAHGKAAYPIGVGTDVLRLVARHKLGLTKTQDAKRWRSQGDRSSD